MQTKKQSLIETSLQVLTDVALNITVAAPLAYFFHNVKTEVITELIIIMTIINFVKSYLIRRLGNYGELKKRITDIQDITKERWNNIDKVIDIFKTGVILLICLNFIILFFVVFLLI